MTDMVKLSRQQTSSIHDEIDALRELGDGLAMLGEALDAVGLKKPADRLVNIYALLYDSVRRIQQTIMDADDALVDDLTFGSNPNKEA